MRKLAIAAAFLLIAPGALAQQAAPPQGPPIIEGVHLIGPPPADGTARAAADRLAMHQHVEPARLQQAIADQQLDPWVAFFPVFGSRFTADRLPHVNTLLQHVLAADGPVIGVTKGAQMRPRPFLSDETLLQCGPADPILRAQSSYPSGHAMIGFSWALVLAEIAPQRANEILLRGREYGDSRVICGVHYPSDIEAGRLLAAAVVARLHADAHFRTELDAARREMARAYPH